MTVFSTEIVALDVIEDNPYQVRKHYPTSKIKDLADSIKSVGLLEIPMGRRVGGKVQLAFGHLRKRALEKLAKKDPESYSTMPVDIRELSNDEMFLFAIEENLKRTDIRPIEVASSVDSYLNTFPDVTEESLAEKLNMTQGNISNMRRVLKLPLEILEKIDQEVINFTMGRELLVFNGLEVHSPREAKTLSSLDLMREAISNLRSGNKTYGEPVTVEGLQRAIHHVASSKLKPLERGASYYTQNPDFDVSEAGCLKCEHTVITHPTKKETSHWCVKAECWEKKQKSHLEKAAAEAKAKMEADIVQRAAQRPESVVSISQEIPAGDGSIPVPCETCANGKTCDRSRFYSKRNGELVCDEKVEMPAGEVTLVDKGDQTAAKVDQKVSRGRKGKKAAVVEEKPAAEIPAEALALAKEKAGTRAEIVDLKDLASGNYGGVSQGYVVLNDFRKEITMVDDPQECLERCTTGFHYAFDSRSRNRYGDSLSPEGICYVCSNPKCLGRKKGALTREKNAEGLAKKKAERKAIKQVVEETIIIDRPRMRVILLAICRSGRPYYGDKTKETKVWLWDKLSPGTQQSERTEEKLNQLIDKANEEEMAKLLMELCFYHLACSTEDLASYRIETEDPLGWLGIKIEIDEKKEEM
jgi:ParB/RepB/Spo0J family partition protein